MKGQNLRILIGSPAKCIALATSCTYHISNTLEDVSTKDDLGGFQKQEVTGAAGDITALDLVLAGTEVDVEFSPTEGTNNRSATGTKYTCKAIVNDISVNAPNRQNVTYTIQMQMNSKPTKVVPQ